MIAKDLILGHEQYEKFDNNNGQKVPEVEPFLLNKSLALYPLQNMQILKSWICFY